MFPRPVGSCSASSAFDTFTSAVTSIHFPEVPVCLSAAHSPLCRFRVVSMRCRNLQISSFGPQHIRQDYPQAARSLSPRLFPSSATVHQADRSAAHLTPAAFPGYSLVSPPTKYAVNQENSLLSSSIQYSNFTYVQFGGNRYELFLLVLYSGGRSIHFISVLCCL